MWSGSVDDRILQLEQKVRQLESNAQQTMTSQPWWERVAGTFKTRQPHVWLSRIGSGMDDFGGGVTVSGPVHLVLNCSELF